jgi:hypothetical protein
MREFYDRCGMLYGMLEKLSEDYCDSSYYKEEN